MLKRIARSFYDDEKVAVEGLLDPEHGGTMLRNLIVVMKDMKKNKELPQMDHDVYDGNVIGPAYYDAQLYLREEDAELHRKTLLLFEDLALSGLQANVAKARESHAECTNLQHKLKKLQSQMESLTKSGRKQDATNHLQTTHFAKDKLEKEIATAKLKAIHATCHAQDQFNLFSLQTMQSILRNQLDSKKRQVAALEEACASLDTHMNAIAERESVMQQEMQQVEQELVRHLEQQGEVEKLFGEMNTLTMREVELYGGEGTVLRVEKTILHDGTRKVLIPGQLLVTSYRVCFCPADDDTITMANEENKEEREEMNCDSNPFEKDWMDVTTTVSSSHQNRGDDVAKISDRHIITVPLASISHVLKSEEGLTIFTEDLASFTFLFENMVDQCELVKGTIESFAYSEENVFAFYFCAHLPEALDMVIYDPVAEFARFGIGDDGSNPFYRLTSVNDDFKICATYPRKWCVPKLTTDENLVHYSKFRSKSRVPILTWKAKDARNCMIRSSQPYFTLSSKSSDAALLKIYGDLSKDGLLHIFDARPKLYAMANACRRGFFENDYIFKNVKVRFLDIDNIHAIRSAFLKLRGSYTKFFGDQDKVEAFLKQKRGEEGNKESVVNWFDHISTIINGAVEIAKSVDQGKSVLVHCSDGWDRTSQLCALAQLLLDPYYRTLEGFFVLIEKDWKSFGHQFSKRLGQISTRDNYLDSQRAPIFTQFLDCVFQVMWQNPNAFQFKPNVLEVIQYHTYSCLYGTFLGNSDKERWEKNIEEKTKSLWKHILSRRTEFVNHDAFHHPSIRLEVSGDKQNFKFWDVYGKRW